MHRLALALPVPAALTTVASPSRKRRRARSGSRWPAARASTPCSGERPTVPLAITAFMRALLRAALLAALPSLSGCVSVTGARAPAADVPPCAPETLAALDEA